MVTIWTHGQAGLFSQSRELTWVSFEPAAFLQEIPKGRSDSFERAVGLGLQFGEIRLLTDVPSIAAQATHCAYATES